MTIQEDEREIKMKDMQEESSKGKVKGNLFWKYFAAGGNVFVVLFVFLLFLLAEGESQVNPCCKPRLIYALVQVLQWLWITSSASG